MEVKTTEYASGRFAIEVTDELGTKVKECYYPIVQRVINKNVLLVGQVFFKKGRRHQNEKFAKIVLYKDYYLSDKNERTDGEDKSFIEGAKRYITKCEDEIYETIDSIEEIRKVIGNDIDEKVRVARETICDYFDKRIKISRDGILNYVWKKLKELERKKGIKK